MKSPAEDFKNCFMNLALPYVIFSEPGPPEVTVIRSAKYFFLWGEGGWGTLINSYASALFLYYYMTLMISSRFILFQREGLSFSNWDKWVVKGTQDFKLKSFLKYFKVSTQILCMHIALLWSRNHAEIFLSTVQACLEF